MLTPIKKIPVFVYETLKKKGIQEQALGHSKPGEPALLKGWEEVHQKTWPSLKESPGKSVSGELLRVTVRELKDLDTWESRYSRHIVHTDKGAAWAYLIKGA